MQMEPQIQEASNGVRFAVNVKPRSRENRLLVEPDGTITLHVMAPPVKGKANRELVRWLAKRLRTKTSQVRIVAGVRSNIKIIEIANMNKSEVSRKIVDDL
jgi:uncharacterized protein (TIGR00251 family)